MAGTSDGPDQDGDPATGHVAGDGSDPVPEVVAHLQAAALEVIAAIRGLLDAAEGLVRDPAAAVTLASSLASRVRPGHDGGDEGDGSGGVQRIPVA